jgi:hypothetical protein
MNYICNLERLRWGLTGPDRHLFILVGFGEFIGFPEFEMTD